MKLGTPNQQQSNEKVGIYFILLWNSTAIE